MKEGSEKNLQQQGGQIVPENCNPPLLLKILLAPVLHCASTTYSILPDKMIPLPSAAHPVSAMPLPFEPCNGAVLWGSVLSCGGVRASGGAL